MNFREEACFFECHGQQLLGILTLPTLAPQTGVVIVVGGPQYRVGSHRQFLLLSRSLAEAGHACIRFDNRGMGDSAGDARDFEHISDDISAAIDTLIKASPSIRKVVLWGLCDAASAALLYWHGTRDCRIGGMVLLNPWVRSESSLARTQVRYYYGQRLLEPEFWKKFFTGNLQLRPMLNQFLKTLLHAQTNSTAQVQDHLCYQEKMNAALTAFHGKILLILSGNDFTAKEFQGWMRLNASRQNLQKKQNITHLDMVVADHTFSTTAWRGEVESKTIAWLDSLHSHSQ